MATCMAPARSFSAISKGEDKDCDGFTGCATNTRGASAAGAAGVSAWGFSETVRCRTTTVAVCVCADGCDAVIRIESRVEVPVSEKTSIVISRKPLLDAYGSLPDWSCVLVRGNSFFTPSSLTVNSPILAPVTEGRSESHVIVTVVSRRVAHNERGEEITVRTGVAVTAWAGAGVGRERFHAIQAPHPITAPLSKTPRKV